VILINNIAVDDTMLTSNIPEPDTAAGEAAWVSGTTYNTGDKLVEGHYIYQVTAATSTDDQPSVGAKKNPQTWVKVAPTNKYAMWDGKSATTSKHASQIVVSIDSGLLTNAIAGFGIRGASQIAVTMTHPTNGQIYSKSVSMVDNSAKGDMYQYLFTPLDFIRTFSLLDLPPSLTSVIQLTVTGTNVEIANVALGSQTTIGTAQKGTTYNIVDTSQAQQSLTDQTLMTQGATATEIRFEVQTPAIRIKSVGRLLSDIAKKPTAWIAQDGTPEQVTVFGLVSDVSLPIKDKIAQYTLEVRGYGL